MEMKKQNAYQVPLQPLLSSLNCETDNERPLWRKLILQRPNVAKVPLNGVHEMTRIDHFYFYNWASKRSVQVQMRINQANSVI
uniref:Uncharacterized protein n=1 Tax=Trichuris muris TaxID=70415 RepID=A0A5S6Q7U1_TRIMR